MLTFNHGRAGRKAESQSTHPIQSNPCANLAPVNTQVALVIIRYFPPVTPACGYLPSLGSIRAWRGLPRAVLGRAVGESLTRHLAIVRPTLYRYSNINTLIFGQFFGTSQTAGTTVALQCDGPFTR